VYTQTLDDMAERIVKNYAVGRLIVTGDNRYLSGDLLDFLVMLLDLKQARTKRERTFFALALANIRSFPRGAFYAPGAAYPRQEVGIVADAVFQPLDLVLVLLGSGVGLGTLFFHFLA